MYFLLQLIHKLLTLRKVFDYFQKIKYVNKQNKINKQIEEKYVYKKTVALHFGVVMQ